MLPINAFSPRGGRSPFNHGMTLEGGGGSWNPVEIVENAVSSTGDVFASIDPGPAISDVGVAIDENITQPVSKGLAEVDTFVNREIPGGWTLPAIIAVAYMTGYFDPSMLAAEGAAVEGGAAAGADVFAGYSATGSAAGTAGTTVGAGYGAAGTGAAVFGTTEGALEVGNLAYSNALANGATVAEANLAADAATQTYMATGYQGAAGTGNLLPAVSGEIGANIGTGASTGFGLNPALPATGAAGVGGGISSALPQGAMLGTGLNGGEIGVSYLAGPNGMVATDVLGQPILANSINFGGFPSDMGVTGSDILKTANDARKAYNVAKFANALINPTDVNRLRSAGLPTGSSGSQQDSSSQAGGSVVGALPGSLKETSLAAAPAIQGNNMNLTQLKQLYPQLAQVDPRILSSLTGKNASIPNYYSYGSDQSAGGTALSSQSQGSAPQPGYPSIAADNKNTNTGFATPTSPSSSYNALSSAGLQAINTGALPGSRYFKDGGNVHVPQFKTGTTGHFVQGAGDGQSDDIPAMLADGEYVFDADTVAALGNGSSKAGALQLDNMRKAIRKHKRSASHDKIPPKAKSPLEYLKGR
jgi:hypothetical protein